MSFNVNQQLLDRGQIMTETTARYKRNILVLCGIVILLWLDKSASLENNTIFGVSVSPLWVRVGFIFLISYNAIYFGFNAFVDYVGWKNNLSLQDLPHKVIWTRLSKWNDLPNKERRIIINKDNLHIYTTDNHSNHHQLIKRPDIIRMRWRAAEFWILGIALATALTVTSLVRLTVYWESETELQDQQVNLTPTFKRYASPFPLAQFSDRQLHIARTSLLKHLLRDRVFIR